MKTFIARFLELSEILDSPKESWSWQPAGNINSPMFAASTTCCGRTRDYDGSSDMGADDAD